MTEEKNEDVTPLLTFEDRIAVVDSYLTLIKSNNDELLKELIPQLHDDKK
jgi:hypothetical protein